MNRRSYIPNYAHDTQVIVKFGNVKMKGSMLKTWKDRYIILCRDSHLGPACFVKYENERMWERNEAKGVILLKTIASVKIDPVKNSGVTLIYKDGSQLDFICETGGDALSWVSKTEDCILAVQSSEAKGVFIVNLLRCNVTNGKDLPCKACLNKDSLIMKKLETDEEIIKWPLKVIKTYQVEQNNTMSIEVGREAQSGGGHYRFSSNQIHNILYRMDDIVRIYKKEREEERIRSQVSSSYENQRAQQRDRRQSYDDYDEPTDQPQYNSGRQRMEKVKIDHYEKLGPIKDISPQYESSRSAASNPNNGGYFTAASNPDNGGYLTPSSIPKPP